MKTEKTFPVGARERRHSKQISKTRYIRKQVKPGILDNSKCKKKKKADKGDSFWMGRVLHL